MSESKHRVMTAVNIASLMALGVILQIGGAYLVNAAVMYFGEASSTSAVAEAAGQYAQFMDRIRNIEPREFAHVIFVGPLVEEIVFRLIFLRAGKMVMPFWAANIVQAVLFGVYHTVIFQKIYGFAMGLIIGCIFHYCPIIYRNIHTSRKSYDEERGRGLIDLPASLLGVMITFVLHMIINATGLFLVPLFPADIALPAQIFIGSALMIAAAGACIMLRRKARVTVV